MLLLPRAAEEPVIKALEVRANAALWTCSALVLFSDATNKRIKLICLKTRLTQALGAW